MKKTSGFSIKPWKKLPEFIFEGARMKALLTIDDTSRLSCYHLTIPPRKKIRPAFHKKAEELIWILKGSGKAKLGAYERPLKAGDALFIHPFTPHGFIGGPSGLVLLAILSPRVDSQTDFYSCEEESHAPPPMVLSGKWVEGKRDQI